MQKTSNTLLSILIPTYNRKNHLQFLLNCLLNQVNTEIKNKVEIIIGNNNSTDGTYELLEQTMTTIRENRSLKIIHHKQNIGAENNFIKLIEESRGRFIWIFGDDDIIFDGALRHIIDLLESNLELGHIFIKPLGHRNRDDVKWSSVNIAANVIEYNNPNDFLMTIGISISFISSNIFNRNYLTKSINPDTFLGSQLIQESYYFQSILNSSKYLLIDGHYISQLLDNSGGYRLFEVFAINQQKIFNFFKDYGLENKTIRSINNKMLKDFFPYYLCDMNKSLQEDPQFQTEQKSQFSLLISNFKYCPKFWFYCFPWFLIPPKCRQSVYNQLKALKLIIKKLLTFNPSVKAK